MRARRPAILWLVGVVLLPGCLELGGAWEPPTTTATTTATTGASASASTTTTSPATSATSTTTTMTGPATTDETATDACSFLCQDIPEDPWCDLWSDDCPDGHKCSPYADDGGSTWNATKCFPLDPTPTQPGEPCEGELAAADTCTKGHLCWEGVCIPMCQGTPEEPICPRGHLCAIHSSGVHNLCEEQCDPLAQDCPESHLCVPLGAGWGCTFDASGEGGQSGDPCEYLNACDPGLICDFPTCTPLCDTTAPNTCPGDEQICVPWYAEGEAPAGYESVGACGIP